MSGDNDTSLFCGEWIGSLSNKKAILINLSHLKISIDIFDVGKFVRRSSALFTVGMSTS
jgi:hypothetical protein